MSPSGAPEALDALLRSIAVLAASLPPAGRARVTPEGSAAPPEARAAAEAVVLDLRALAPLLPLGRGPGLREVPEVDILPGGVATLRVCNAEGRREHVTRWYARDGFQDAVLGWARARTGSLDAGTPWDEARRVRRTVAYRGREVLLDPGAALPVDLVAALGAETEASCEGHPGGAYLAWRGGPESLGEALAELGWRVSGGGADGRTLAYMPAVPDVHARDALWRTACAALARLAPSPIP